MSAMKKKPKRPMTPEEFRRRWEDSKRKRAADDPEDYGFVTKERARLLTTITKPLRKRNAAEAVLRVVEVARRARDEGDPMRRYWEEAEKEVTGNLTPESLKKLLQRARRRAGKPGSPGRPRGAGKK